jgi:hypothetical protein
MPSGLPTGNYDIQVDDNGASAHSSGPFQIVAPGTPFISLDANTNNVQFGNVSVGSSKNITFTIVNTGTGTGSANATMTSTASTLSAPFSYLGGTFPGTGGTCVLGGTITAGNSCKVVVSFTPLSTGNFSSGIVNLVASPGYNVNLMTGTGI